MQRIRSPRSSLTERSHIVGTSLNLASVLGAQKLIAMILSRRVVTKLTLRHNYIGDDGCIELFEFLNSDAGQAYQITDIIAHSCMIGNQGLVAIIKYVRKNRFLKGLILSNNDLTGNDPTLWASFADAINTSRLTMLSLTGNHKLSNNFLAHFLPVLDSPHLLDLKLSAIYLSKDSVPHILEFMTSPRCHLRWLNCNANFLEFSGVRSIVLALEYGNHTICSAEFFANSSQTLGDPSLSDESQPYNETDSDILLSWAAVFRHLGGILTRNQYLVRETMNQALLLLRYARLLLLHVSVNPSEQTSNLARNSPSHRSMPSPTVHPIEVENESVDIFPFASLPSELKVHTLSFLAPALSSAQQFRIFQYASSGATLPNLLPSPYSASAAAVKGRRLEKYLDPWETDQDCSAPAGLTSGGNSPNLKILGAMNNKDRMKEEWLDLVGCSFVDYCRAGRTGSSA